MSASLLAVLSLDEVASYWGVLKVPIDVSVAPVLRSAARESLAELVERYGSWAEAVDPDQLDPRSFPQRLTGALTEADANSFDSWWVRVCDAVVGDLWRTEFLWFSAVAGVAGKLAGPDTEVVFPEVAQECERLRRHVLGEIRRIQAYGLRLDSADLNSWDRKVVRFFAASSDLPSWMGLLAFLSNLVRAIAVDDWWASCCATLPHGTISVLRREIERELDELSCPPALRKEPIAFRRILDGFGPRSQ